MEKTEPTLRDQLDCQRKAFLADGAVSLETRIDRLDRAIAILVDYQDDLCEAMSADFGHRSLHQSKMTDIYGAIEPLKYARKHTKRWMKAEKRKVQVPMNIFGGKARIEYQPKGVVGCISTWNFPVWVPFSPLAGIFAAGNRSMIKLSEFTPETSHLIAELIGRYFDESELLAVNGGTDVGAEFSALPFDHMIFTGATGVGKHVMRAAAENLVPVTLELGGKSPVVISRSTNLAKAAGKIIAGKMINVGQVCLAPDYVFCPSDIINDFIAECENAMRRMFPTILDNDDVSSVVNERHFERLQSYLRDAEEKGAEIRPLNMSNESFSHQSGQHKMPLTLIIEPSDELKVMEEEIFGPILPIKTYGHIDDVIDYIRQRPRPLGLYYFGTNKKEYRQLLDRTHSGGVTVNDVIAHAGCEDLPFGGVGASGMGSYHGREGFKTFSHARSVYTQSAINLLELAGFTAPYSDKMLKTLTGMIKK